MAYQTFAHNVIQLGAETTAGTPVAATEKWRSEFVMLKDTRERNTIEENVGLLVPAERIYDGWLAAELAMSATPMTFEQLPHILEAGIDGVTPSGAGPYVRDYVFPTGTTYNTIKTYTIETGNVNSAADNREAPYCFVESAKFSGNVKQPWNMEATWRGQQLASSTLTPALALLDVEEAIFAKTELYIDATGGTIGTTQLTGVLMSAEINIEKTGVMEVPTADGTNYYTNHKYTAPSISFSLTFELENTENAVSDARSAFESDSIKLIQMTIPGSGTSEVRFRFAGRYTDFGDYTNDDGNTSVQVGGRVVNSTTDALYFECQVTNGRATL